MHSYRYCFRVVDKRSVKEVASNKKKMQDMEYGLTLYTVYYCSITPVYVDCITICYQYECDHFVKL